jgi:hypothetical protein
MLTGHQGLEDRHPLAPGLLQPPYPQPISVPESSQDEIGQVTPADLL